LPVDPGDKYMIPISKPYIGPEEKQAVMEVLDSGMLVQGPRTAQLEEKFSVLCQTKYAVATSSGTSALHIALLAHGIGKGDEVITSPFTFFATVSSILYTGATPIFVDIEEDTFNINSDLIEAAITPKTKAILPVHLYGYPCEMEKITQIAKKHNLVIIEDAAQAVGASINGKMTGSFGTGCFSLYATKNVMSVEGGIITTDDESIAKSCKLIRNHGMERRYYHDRLGYNLRMTDLHAAIGLAQFERLGKFTEARTKNAAFLNAKLTSVITPNLKSGYKHVWHQYTIRIQHRDRDEAVKFLNDNGVGTGIFYPVPAYAQQPCLDAGIKQPPLPVTEKIVREVVSLPVHPLLSQEDLNTIVSVVNRL